jgi:hypothetical protein
MDPYRSRPENTEKKNRRDTGEQAREYRRQSGMLDGETPRKETRGIGEPDSEPGQYPDSTERRRIGEETERHDRGKRFEKSARERERDSESEHECRKDRRSREQKRKYRSGQKPDRREREYPCDEYVHMTNQPPSRMRKRKRSESKSTGETTFASRKRRSVESRTVPMDPIYRPDGIVVVPDVMTRSPSRRTSD